MKSVVARLAILAIIYSVAELCWLSLMAPFYERQFARFGQAPPLGVRSVPAAVGAYAVLLGAFYVLVLRSREVAGVWHGVSRGLAFGIAVYGVYNLTNKATLRGYSWTMVAVDTAWGTFAFAALAGIYCVLSR